MEDKSMTDEDIELARMLEHCRSEECPLLLRETMAEVERLVNDPKRLFVMPMISSTANWPDGEDFIAIGLNLKSSLRPCFDPDETLRYLGIEGKASEGLAGEVAPDIVSWILKYLAEEPDKYMVYRPYTLWRGVHHPARFRIMFAQRMFPMP